MNAIISKGDKTAHVQLPVERKQLAGALSYLGAPIPIKINDPFLQSENNDFKAQKSGKSPRGQACAVLRRGHFVLSFEQLDEIVHVKDPDLCRDRLDLLVRMAEEKGGALHSFSVHVIREGLSAFLFEKRGKIAGVDVHGLGNAF